MVAKDRIWFSGHHIPSLFCDSSIGAASIWLIKHLSELVSGGFMRISRTFHFDYHPNSTQ